MSENNIVDECGWRIDCIVSRVVEAIRKLPSTAHGLNKHLSILPKELLREVAGRLTEREVGLLAKSYADPPAKVAELLSLVDPSKLSSVDVVERVYEILMVRGFPREAASFAERGIELSGGQAASRFRAMASLARAMSMVSDAEVLHEQGRHDEEYSLLNRAMEDYVEAYRNYMEVGMAREANEAKALGLRAMAQYHFTHGNIGEARSMYIQCSSALRWIEEDSQEALECIALAKLCEAMEESSSELYEEAGDLLMKASQGNPELLELAVMAYGAALQVSQDRGDLYAKYFTALVSHVDYLINVELGGFGEFSNILKSECVDGASRRLNIPAEAIKAYLTAKALTAVYGIEGFKAALIMVSMGMNLLDSDRDAIMGVLKGLNLDVGRLNDAYSMLSSIAGPCLRPQPPQGP